ncbi:hypothetical protein BY458DRAFT_583017 [Sporodiniella umbellata]|nr:hypothetical protein BY458DRAFT_583017 [Sporodiniella umbellata]
MVQPKHIQYGFILCLIVGLLYVVQRAPRSESVKKKVKDWRLSERRRAVIASVLSRIQTSYKVNATPEVSTPPVLVYYSCHESPCGTLAERMRDVAHAYYFALVQSPDTAFVYDMRSPVRWEDYFEPSPWGMAMGTQQAELYLRRVARVSTLPELKVAPAPPLAGSLLRTTRWATGQLNATRGERRGRFGLDRLRQESEWFLVVSRLLFQRPSDWLLQALTPYRPWLGTIRLNEGLSVQDPANRLTPAAVDFIRVGIRLTDFPAPALIDYLAGREGRYFVSATHPEYIQALRQACVKPVEAVDPYFPFTDLDSPSSGSPRVYYARVFMDFTLLSRADVLLGDSAHDLFFRQVAWTAQAASTLLLAANRTQMVPLMEW